MLVGVLGALVSCLFFDHIANKPLSYILWVYFFTVNVPFLYFCMQISLLLFLTLICIFSECELNFLFPFHVFSISSNPLLKETEYAVPHSTSSETSILQLNISGFKKHTGKKLFFIATVS